MTKGRRSAFMLGVGVVVVVVAGGAGARRMPPAIARHVEAE